MVLLVVDRNSKSKCLGVRCGKISDRAEKVQMLQAAYNSGDVACNVRTV